MTLNHAQYDKEANDTGFGAIGLMVVEKHEFFCQPVAIFWGRKMPPPPPPADVLRAWCLTGLL